MNPPGLRYFDDYVLGASYDCGSVSINEASIVAFAKGFDPQPIHADPVAAASGPFGGLIASGWHTAGLVMRLLVENYLSVEASLGGAGADEIRWPYPVRPGDTLRVRATVDQLPAGPSIRFRLKGARPCSTPSDSIGSAWSSATCTSSTPSRPRARRVPSTASGSNCGCWDAAR